MTVEQHPLSAPNSNEKPNSTKGGGTNFARRQRMEVECALWRVELVSPSFRRRSECPQEGRDQRRSLGGVVAIAAQILGDVSWEDLETTQRRNR